MTNVKIDVKTGNKTKAHGYNFYSFNLEKKQQTCDLYIVYCLGENKNIEKIYIVAHSMGGECTMQILKNNEDDLLSGKIKKIAFTDSVHGSSYKILSVKGKEILKDIARDFVAS